MGDKDYLKDAVPSELKPLQRFWNGTADVYSNAKLTTEGGEDLEAILSKVENAQKLICVGVATGCRDPLFFLESGKIYPEKIVVNDLSPKLLKICYGNLNRYSHDGLDVLALEGALHFSFEKHKEELLTFLGESEPLFSLGVYRKEVFYNKFNDYSALELYSIERENIGNECLIYPIVYDGTLQVEKSAVIDFKLPLNSRQLRTIEKHLRNYERTTNFGGFQFNSQKNGNAFISHYYTRDCLQKLLLGVFSPDSYDILIVDTRSRNYVAFVTRKNAEQDSLITMINNVLGNIPLDLQIQSLNSIKDTFYQK